MRKMWILTITAVLLLSLWLTGQSEWHIARNKHNIIPKGKLEHLTDTHFKDQAGRIWDLQSPFKNLFHQPGAEEERQVVEKPYPNVIGELNYDPDNPNLKFLSALDNGGSYEAILQPNGEYLTSGLKQGTYNYGHPSGIWGMIRHALFDVLPHFVNGNYEETVPSD